MFKPIKKQVRKSLRRFGYDIIRYHPTMDATLRRSKLIDHYNIDKILDVGANIGNFAAELRTMGFDGEIISFEPLSDAFKKLKEKADQDDKWRAVNIALGDKNHQTEIHISKNSLSSSISEMLSAHLNSAPESKFIGKEEIKVKTLDSMFDDFYSRNDNILLKIDTQGYEKNVLKGAEKSLEVIDTLQVELSLTHLYQNDTLFSDMIKILNNKGYSLVHLEHVFSDPKTGRLLQVDGIFHRL